MQITGHYGNAYSNPLTDTSIAELYLSLKGNFFCMTLQRSVEESFYQILKIVETAYEKVTSKKSQTRCFDSRFGVINVEDKSSFITIRDHNYANDDPWEPIHRTIEIKGVGDYDIVGNLNTHLRKTIIESKIPTLTWEYLDGTSRKSQQINIERAKLIHDEFYPWINGTVNNFFEQYITSESPVLVLLGEPGTAKTSLIRSMIWQYTLKTIFTYDEQLLAADSMFADFIAGDAHLLVIEDADVFLKSRHHDGNRIMSKFLNIGDGLASNRRKKIIFTANIVDPSQIDSALVRPGRCFDCLTFRKLSYQEACRAAEAAGINIPVEEQPYSLAELFAASRGEPVKTNFPKKIGFGL